MFDVAGTGSDDCLGSIRLTPVYRSKEFFRYNGFFLQFTVNLAIFFYTGIPVYMKGIPIETITAGLNQPHSLKRYIFTKKTISSESWKNFPCQFELLESIVVFNP